MRDPNIGVPILLFVLAFVFMSPGLPPLKVAASMHQLLVFPPWQAVYPDVTSTIRGGDPIQQQLPWRHWAQDELAAGRFPLWASGPLGGAPIFAYYQSAVLYPLNLLWVLVPIWIGAGIVMALKLWLAGLGMWVFLRALKLHWTASLLGALGFMFCTSMVVWLPWAHTNVFLLMPWLAWSIYAWCVEEKRWAPVALAITLGCAVLGGHPENLSIVTITAGIWALGLIAGSAPQRWPRQVGGLLVGGIVGLAIGAVQVLPFLEAYNLSHIALDPGRAVAWQIHQDASMMMDWIMPRWWGQIFDGVVDGPLGFYDTGYVGLPALVGLGFGVVALVRRRLNLRLVLPLLAMLVFAWIITYDDNFGNLIRQLPAFSHSLNMRWVFSVEFSVLVLGAFGWDWFARFVDERRRTTDAGNRGPENAVGNSRVSRITYPVVVGIVLLVVGVVILIEHWVGLFQQPDLGTPRGNLATASYRFYWGIWVGGVALSMAGAILLWWLGWLGRRTAPVMGLVMGGLLTADLWMLLFTFNPGAPANWYYPVTDFIGQTKSLVPSPERLVAQGEVMVTNTGLVYDIRDWRYQDPMISERSFQAAELLSPGFKNELWTRYNMYFSGIRLEVAPIFGIRYVVFPGGANPDYREPDPEMAPLKRLAFTGGVGLWEIEGVPGFTYLSDYVEAVPGEAEARKWVQNLTWEKVRAYPAVVEAPASALANIARSTDGTSPGSTDVVAYTPGHIVIETDAQRPALLVVAESYYPGWHATLDGQPVETLRANYISQGVVVPAGKHTVEMKYEPDSFRNGALLSVAGLLGLGGLIVWWRRGARRA